MRPAKLRRRSPRPHGPDDGADESDAESGPGSPAATLQGPRQTAAYNHLMVPRFSKFPVAAAAAMLSSVVLVAQSAAPQVPPAPGQQPTFRARADLVTSDVIVRDGNGQFTSDLKKEEFEIYEDGVKQDIVSMVLVHGGRTFNVEAPPPPATAEGIILPAKRPTNDAAG